MSAPLRDLTPAQRRGAGPIPEPAARAVSPAPERRLVPLAPLFALGGIVLGAIEQYLLNAPEFAHALWTIALVGAGFPVVWRTLAAARRGNFATDLVASLSIVTAAMIGQPLAGLVIVLMQTGGESL